MKHVAVRRNDLFATYELPGLDTKMGALFQYQRVAVLKLVRGASCDPAIGAVVKQLPGGRRRIGGQGLGDGTVGRLAGVK